MRLSRILVAALLVACVARIDVTPLRAGPETPAKAGEKKLEEVEKAEKAFLAKNFDEALKLFKEAEKKDPKQPPARLALAKMFYAVAASNANSQEAKTELIRAYHNSMEAAAAETPGHPDIYLQFGNVAYQEGRITDTILDCNEALVLSKDPKWTADQRKGFEKECQAGLSVAFESRKDWESAKTHLMAWKALDPKAAPVMVKLARALFYLNKPEEAYAELLAAEHEDKTLVPAEVTLAQLWVEKAEPAKAEEWFQKAISKNPKLAKVHQAYAEWLLNTGNLTAAKLSIDQAKQIDPTSGETRFLMGFLARLEKKYDAAEKIFEELYKEHPGTFIVTNNLALVLAEQTSSPAQQQRALELAEVNVKSNSRNAEAWATLGWVRFLAGRDSEAEQAFNVAISSGQLAPDTAYYVSAFLERKDASAFADKIRSFLEAGTATKAPFIHRADAEKLLATINKKYPKKEEPKKDEAKKDAPVPGKDLKQP